MAKKLNPNLIKILNILNDGQYHDGTSIGAKLNMTRSAVWKIIKKLEEYGVDIDSVKGKGYALREPLILLDAAKIKKKITPKQIGITIFESIPSTQDYLKSLKHKENIQICLTEKQTEGKGRLGREWYSPFGKNIYCSCFFPFQKDISELSGLSLVTSLAMVKTLKKMGIHKNIFVKWPNDIVCENEKLGGGLIEILAESHGLSHVVIGIGMNVNMIVDAENITQKWTSLQKITGHSIDRNELCAQLIDTLLNHLYEFATHGFAPFIEEWIKLDNLMNQTITLKNVNTIIKGKVKGVNDQGHLLLELNTGRVQAFSSGDTSIVKN